MLYNVLLIVQVVISVSIIGLVLIQHGKGADAGAAFGSGASGTVFGSRGSGSFLSRSTAILATLFFANSLALAWIVAHKPETTSLVDGIVAAPAVTQEAKPTTVTDKGTEAVEAAKPEGTTETTPPAAKSPADDIPADTGETAVKPATTATDKASDIPE